MASSNRPLVWKFINSRLAKKQLVFILLFSSIITLIGTVIQVYLEYRSDILYVDIQFRQIESAHLESLTNSLWQLDQSQINVQLDSILSMRDIVFIEVIEKEKVIFSAGDEKPLSKVVHQNYLMQHDNGDVMETIGVLRAYASLESVYNRVFTRVLVILTTQGFKTFLVSLFILFVIHHMVIRHLIRISAYAQKLSLDELDRKLELDKKQTTDKAPDELDLLSTAVNDMRERLIDDLRVLKQTQEALNESEQNFKILVQTIPLGVQLSNLEGKILYCNPAYHRIHGYEEGELIGKFIWDTVTEKSKKLKSERNYRKVMKQQSSPTTYYSQARKKDGRVIDTQINWDYILDAEGQVQGLISIISDISYSKKMEADLRQSRKIESLGTLTGGIAHDFNNILGIIIGNIELALNDLPEWHAAYDNLVDIKSASLRAAGIVKQLLSYTRRTDEAHKPINIIPIIEDILKLVRATFPSTIAIEKRFLAQNQTVLAAPDQINRLLMNLCINASQAMEQTGGILDIRVENQTMHQSTHMALTHLAAGDYIKIIISDTGPGIPSDIIDNVFDPYFTTKEVGKGSGMGLAVARGIVNNHNGVITVQSPPGQGASFTILLPVTTKMPEQVLSPVKNEVAGNETILFVDDEPPIIKMVGRMLRGLGYRVDAKLNPEEALSEFSKTPNRYDLVITDMTMPQMTGTALSEKLFAIRKDIPIILCTGHSALIDQKGAKAMGIAAYLMKPIANDELARMVRQVLDNQFVVPNSKETSQS